MGDDGIKYDMFTPKLLEKMKALAEAADIITPNLTELCLLTDASYDTIMEITDKDILIDVIGELASTLLPVDNDYSKEIIVTGIHFNNEHGQKMMGNLYISQKSRKLFAFPHVGGSYSGTGDLFASCIAAGKCRGDKIPDLIHLAGTFLEQAIKDSAEENVPYPDGTNYEKYLHLLMMK